MANGEVWTIAEVQNGELHPVSLELLTEARKVAEKLGHLLSATVLMGALKETMPECLGTYGAQRVYVPLTEKLSSFHGDIYTKILTRLLEVHHPVLVIGPATPDGNEYLPRVAHRAGMLYLANCTVNKVVNLTTIQSTRPVFGGKFAETVELDLARPAMITIRPGVVEPEKAKNASQPEIVEFDLGSDELASRTEFVEFIKGDPATIDLTEAEIIVAGGRGVGSRENWRLIEELARAMGGSVGGSRAAVDEGWIPFERQVGQTGKTVRPKLYVACGISGAIYHTAGIKDAGHIVAINTDPGAEIFKIADLGLVGDLREVIPAFLEQLRKNGVRKDAV